MRARLMLLAGVVLLALDLGRSYYARVGFAHPSEVWQPNPAVYADLAWPPGADVGSDRPLGERVYARRCAVCHGPDGRGNGPAAPSMIPRPRDFTLALFKYKSTPGNEAPTDADLRRVVTRGLAASAMPTCDDGKRAVESRELSDVDRADSPLGAWRKARRTRPSTGSSQARRLSRPRRDVRALPYADRPHGNLPRRSLSRRRHARHCIPTCG